MNTTSLSNELDECGYQNCNPLKITSLRQYNRAKPCDRILTCCQRFMKLYKNGYECIGTKVNKFWSEKGFYDTKDDVSIEELKHFLEHMIILRHPKKSQPLECFSFPRFRSCISLASPADVSNGFFVSDACSVAFLKLNDKKSKLHCLYVDLITLESQETVIALNITDPELCSIFLKYGSLWIAQNAEVGVINIALVCLNEKPPRLINRNFGTMDYWNPEGRLNVTEFELIQDFLHVTLNFRSKLIRKHVRTLKNSFMIPARKRYLIIDYLDDLRTICFHFHRRIENDILRSIQKDCLLERKYFTSVVSEESQKAAVRINASTILVLDFIHCNIIQSIDLQHCFNKVNVTFQLSASGRTLYIIGEKKDQAGQYAWSRHIVSYDETLRCIAMRKLREFLPLADVPLNIPRTLRNELTFQHS